jgi:hypothetical protein
VLLRSLKHNSFDASLTLWGSKTEERLTIRVMSIGQSRQDRINVLEEENYSIMAPRAQVAAIREDPLMRAVEIIPVCNMEVLLSCVDVW